MGTSKEEPTAAKVAADLAMAAGVSPALRREPVKVEEPTIVKQRGDALVETYALAQFQGELREMTDQPYRHYRPVGKERFEKLAYTMFGGLTRSQIGDVHAYVLRTAPELDSHRHLIRFGISVVESVMNSHLRGDDADFNLTNRLCVFDTRTLQPQYTDLDDAVWHCPYPLVKDQLREDAPPIPFILALAGGDSGKYDDIMQTLAPIVMEKKPDGVIWFVGEGANGKSTLMNALHNMFPDQLASITVKELEDGRANLSLQGAFANIVRESSEGRVEDTQVYKALGTHEKFTVRKFYSQSTIAVDGNIHTIFSANTIPAFNDKGYSARRRTFIIPFTQTFDSDPTFEERTFTPEFYGRLAAEMVKYSRRLVAQHYHYKFSPATAGVKEEYDREAGTADEYIREMVVEYGLIAFDTFEPLKRDYDNWCAESGYVPVGVRLLRKAATAAGFEYVSFRQSDGVKKIYRLSTATPDMEIVQMNARHGSNMFTKMLGLYTTPGFGNVAPPTDPEPIIPDEPPKRSSILNHKW